MRTSRSGEASGGLKHGDFRIFVDIARPGAGCCRPCPAFILRLRQDYAQGASLLAWRNHRPPRHARTAGIRQGKSSSPRRTSVVDEVPTGSWRHGRWVAGRVRVRRSLWIPSAITARLPACRFNVKLLACRTHTQSTAPGTNRPRQPDAFPAVPWRRCVQPTRHAVPKSP